MPKYQKWICQNTKSGYAKIPKADMPKIRKSKNTKNKIYAKIPKEDMPKYQIKTKKYYNDVASWGVEPKESI